MRSRPPARRRSAASFRCSTRCAPQAIGSSGSARASPAGLAVREDLRTRLGWGLVYEISPLVDDEKPAALSAYARRRGFAVPDEVIRYLLGHARRDMPTLLGALAALDRHSLALRRPVTLSLLREWLQQGLD